MGGDDDLLVLLRRGVSAHGKNDGYVSGSNSPVIFFFYLKYQGSMSASQSQPAVQETSVGTKANVKVVERC